jgi:hypothetical protein
MEIWHVALEVSLASMSSRMAYGIKMTNLTMVSLVFLNAWSRGHLHGQVAGELVTNSSINVGPMPAVAIDLGRSLAVRMQLPVVEKSLLVIVLFLQSRTLNLFKAAGLYIE